MGRTGQRDRPPPTVRRRGAPTTPASTPGRSASRSTRCHRRDRARRRRSARRPAARLIGCRLPHTTSTGAVEWGDRRRSASHRASWPERATRRRPDHGGRADQQHVVVRARQPDHRRQLVVVAGIGDGDTAGAGQPRRNAVDRRQLDSIGQQRSPGGWSAPASARSSTWSLRSTGTPCSVTTPPRQMRPAAGYAGTITTRRPDADRRGDLGRPVAAQRRVDLVHAHRRRIGRLRVLLQRADSRAAATSADACRLRRSTTTPAGAARCAACGLAPAIEWCGTTVTSHPSSAIRAADSSAPVVSSAVITNVGDSFGPRSRCTRVRHRLRTNGWPIDRIILA